MATPILVPIQVDALVIDAPMPVPDKDDTKPFHDTDSLAPGVHVTWALPDALVRARVENPGDKDMRFPAVPDLWLVVRFNPPGSGGFPQVVPHALRTGPVDQLPGGPVHPVTDPRRSWVAWVVDARRGTTTPLESWSPPAIAPGRPRFTAQGELPDGKVSGRNPGQPVGPNRLLDHGYYPASRQRFGLFDPLTGVAGGPVSYLVAGWYSSLADDPLYAAAPGDRKGLLDGMKWNGPWDRLFLWPVLLDMARTVNIALPSLKAQPATSAPSARAVKGTPAAAVQQAVKAREQHLAAATASGIKVNPGGLTIRPVGSPVPDRIYCHGAIVDVKWKTGGGGIAAKLQPLPPNTLPELLVSPSLYSAAAHAVAVPTMADILQALEQNLVGDMASNEGKEGLAQRLHAGSFSFIPGELTEAWYMEVYDADATLSGDGRYNLADVPSNVATLTVRDYRRAAARQRLPQSVSRSGAGTLAPPGTQVVVRKGWLPGPRFYKPNAPVVLFKGFGRSWRYGQDGRLDPNRTDQQDGIRSGGLLQCRSGAQLVTGVTIEPPDGSNVKKRVSVGPDDLIVGGPPVAALPPALTGLIREAALLDPTSSALMASAWISHARPSSVDRAGIATAFEQATEAWWGLADNPDDAQGLAAQKLFTGTLPSQIALCPWSQPWLPLFAEIEYEFHPCDPCSPAPPDLRRGWSLGDVEWEPSQNPADLKLRAAPIVGSERCLLSVAVSMILENTALELLKHLPYIDQYGDVHPTGGVDSGSFYRLDVLSATLQSLDAQLAAAGLPERTGTLALRRLRLIDAFGQVKWLFDTQSSQHTVMNLEFDQTDTKWLQSVSSSGSPQLALLRPRLPYWSRLQFRFLDVMDPNRDADPEHSPVCGFIIPDFVEHGVEVFDATGRGLGQLVHKAGATPGDTKVVWQSYPWAPAQNVAFTPSAGDPAASGPGDPGWVIANPHLRRMMRAVLAQPAQGGDTGLSAMLRAIDTTQTTVSRQSASTHALTHLIGRPIAVVRAGLTLETAPAGMANPLANGPFSNIPWDAKPKPLGVQARLGSLTQTDDGLLGYFAADDYSAFRPVDPLLLDHALDSGPYAGYQAGDANPVIRPITHPFVSRAAVVELPANQLVPLLMLMEPRNSVYVTSGVLPRKDIQLTPELIEEGLQALAPTFTTGPVLVDPDKPALPLPVLPAQRWDWMHYTDPSSPTPTIQPVTQTTDSLVTTKVVAEDGWLKLDAAPPQNKPPSP